MMNYKVITAIVCITVLECVALYKGINGTAFAGAVGIIAGLGGYSINSKKGVK